MKNFNQTSFLMKFLRSFLTTKNVLERVNLFHGTFLTLWTNHQESEFDLIKNHKNSIFSFLTVRILNFIFYVNSSIEARSRLTMN